MKIDIIKKNLLNILFWSVISAAFIGPGTITTAAKAGTLFQLNLLWALTFSTIACIILQEACARLTIISGLSLGQAIKKSYEGSQKQGLVIILISGAIILGSAAYQTGNLLGAAAGVVLVSDIPLEWVIIGMALGVFFILSLPKLQIIAHILGGIVAIMGIVFLTSAFLLGVAPKALLYGSFIPTFPPESSVYILGLVGTTVVPYNLFLGSGLSTSGQSLFEMRVGLSVAIILGGIISMAVLVTGTVVEGAFSFEAFALALDNRLGAGMSYLLAIGLWAAGFSSAITAPLASAMTAQSLFAKDHSPRWASHALYFKLTWGGVLLTGVLLGLSGIKPIPAIILAQALNGLLLPFVSIFLLYVMNNPKILGENQLNSWINNMLMGFVVWVSLVLGLINIFKAWETATGFTLLDKPLHVNLILVFAGLCSIGLAYRIFRKRLGH
ncbi:MAG: divalent metal cation transporter [Microscillaceae bacterium]|nr:divalent metal cation transporter [Microscillaceae bacterium]